VLLLVLFLLHEVFKSACAVELLLPPPWFSAVFIEHELYILFCVGEEDAGNKLTNAGVVERDTTGVGS
jgi:hypothetical protein